MCFTTCPEPRLGGIILLLVAEVADADTIKALLVTNKENHELLRKYEHSTCMAAIPRFTLPPSGNVLSSRMPRRMAIPAFTFSVVEELELRQRNIDNVVNGQFLTYKNETKLARQVSEVRMKAYLRRALHQCDRIADIEANSYHSKTWCEGRSSYYNTAVIFAKNSADTSDIPFDLVYLWIQRIRERQYDYIATLSLDDLAGLWMLGYLSLQGYARYQVPLMENDPVVLEKGTCFGENVLRHGSFFIHTYCCGDNEPLYGHALTLVDHTWNELQKWETGDPDEMDGLRMTIAIEFADKANCQVADIPDKVLRVLSGLPLEDKDEVEGEDADEVDR